MEETVEWKTYADKKMAEADKIQTISNGMLVNHRYGRAEDDFAGNSLTVITPIGIHHPRISVIAPYSAHVKTLRSVLDGSGITCKTIHKMLGGENDIIILATTRSNNSRDLGFVNQPELLNVATSRQLMKHDGETFSEGSKASRKIYDFIYAKACML
jgi:hypothetical protein